MGSTWTVRNARRDETPRKTSSAGRTCGRISRWSPMPSCGFSHLPLDLKKQPYLLQYSWLAIGSDDKWHCTVSRQNGAAKERQSWNTLGRRDILAKVGQDASYSYCGDLGDLGDLDMMAKKMFGCASRTMHTEHSGRHVRGRGISAGNGAESCCRLHDVRSRRRLSSMFLASAPASSCHEEVRYVWLRQATRRYPAAAMHQVRGRHILKFVGTDRCKGKALWERKIKLQS